MNFDFDYMISVFPVLLKALPLTLLMAIVSMVMAVIIGGVLALITKGKIPVLYQLASVYISFFRAVPTIVQLFLIYFGLPQLFPAFSSLDALSAAIIGLSLKNSSYLAEIFRAALYSVDEGQLEACMTVGMTKTQAYIHIIIPQAIRNAIPATGNTFIGLLKETALAFTIGVTEMLASGKMAAASTLRFFEAYMAVALIYWVLVIGYSALQSWFERKINRPYVR
ncbi:amino acid ABC transporter permease [Alkalicoccobacillus gibsonii]|uniref:amino acid ABC transporter permease n=1 Tax=Alkalicoccobacillus gibsonii TaxID=79881 RepID=UPI003F7BCF6D